MKLYKLFFIAAIALGFMACNADDQPEVSQHETDSYASITVKFPGKVGTRALPDDYNKNGIWTGRDTLESVDVFLVNTVANTVDYNTFVKSSFESIDANGILKPNLALKATADSQVRAYVVINGVESILNQLKATAAADFATTFAEAQNMTASQVATLNGDLTETIMMTNVADTFLINVAPGITEAVAIAGTSNHITVNVERVVSRAIMTIAPEVEKGDGWPVNAFIAGAEKKIATVIDVTYAVGQSNKNFYLMKKADYDTPDPVYTFNPADLTAWTAQNQTILDYSGLANFTPVTQWTYAPANVSEPLAAEETSKFVLPVNHVVKETNLTTARNYYKKGNTTYFEIQAKFIPTEVITDSEGATVTPDTAATVYWGANDKKFYNTRALAEAEGQKATEFTNGVMKYVLWLNPNSLESVVKDPNPKVSPTIRNQVYHAHIEAFLRMGLPDNPLNPNDTANQGDPENAIKPFDPLKNDITYLAVSVQVLPWTIHTYSYSLTDPGTMY